MQAPFPASPVGLTSRVAFRESVIRIAELQYQRKELAAARDSLARLESCSAHTLETLETFAYVCFLLGDHESAARALCRVLVQNPCDAGLLVSLALTSYHLNDLPGCDRCVQRALACDPDHPEALKLLADRHVHQEQYEQAAPIYRGLVDRHPKTVEILLLLAKCDFYLDDMPAARAALEHALAVEPGNEIVRDNLALLRMFDEPAESTALAPEPVTPAMPASLPSSQTRAGEREARKSRRRRVRIRSSAGTSQVVCPPVPRARCLGTEDANTDSN